MTYIRDNMRVLLGCLILSMVILNCNNSTESQSSFNKIKKGMGQEEVSKLMGEPTQQITLGELKETGDKVKRWHYGNKAITFIGDSVIRKTSDQQQLNEEIEEMKEEGKQSKID